jgi:Glycosyl transferase family 64 domain
MHRRYPFRQKEHQIPLTTSLEDDDDDGSPRRIMNGHSNKSIHFANQRRRRQRNNSNRCCPTNKCLRVTVVLLFLLACYFYFMFGARIPVNKIQPHPPPRPFAYPPPNCTVTVVLMNYARPRMLQVSTSSLLPVLLQHPAVTEILLCHANAKTAFAYHHPKVINIDAVETNQQLGMALRFYYCNNTATNEWVIHVDDDMELDESAINELIYHMRINPHRIVGHYARQYNFWKVPHRHGYDFGTVTEGPAEVILTKLLVTERRICHEFLRHAHLMNDMALTATPVWNGEDIFLSLVANHYYGVPWTGPFVHYAIAELNVWEADNSYKDDDSGERDVSANLDRHNILTAGWTDYWTAWYRQIRHMSYRGRFWATAKARLATLHSGGDEI